MDIGMDLGAAASEEYHAQAPFAFNGTISQVHVKYTRAQSEEPAIVPGD